MSVLPVGFGSSGGYIIENSVRLRASASAYFSRQFGAPTDNKKWTLSQWIKRGALSLADDQHLFMVSDVDVGTNPTNYSRLLLTTSGTLSLQSSGSASEAFTSSALYRDPIAHMHVMLVMDCANTSVKCYVNGTEISYASRTNPTNTNPLGNKSGNYHRFGLFRTAEPRPFDGLLSDVHFIDGQALTPSSFGETNADGVWVPKAYTGTYGTNGFKLDFADAAVTSGSNAGLGKDTSGNGNYWNTNNISVTAGVTYDSMVDTPTNNYATINALDYNNTYLTLSAANLQQTYAGVTAAATSRGTLGIPTTDKWYWEVYITATGGGSGERIRVGICKDEAISGNTIDNSATHYMQMSNGQKRTGTTDSTYGSSFSATQIMQVLYDADAGSLYFGQNNSFANGTGIFDQLWSGAAAAFTGLSGQFFPAQITYGGADIAINFGQRPFTYTPPTGFKALCTANLPAVAIKNPKKHFNAKTRTGTAATFSVTGELFQPGMVWTKGRSGATDHAIYDAVRGVEKRLETNNTDAEVTGDTTGLTAFNSDGFTGGALAQINTNSATYIDWMWKANGAGSSNTDGSRTSTVSANITAGFSIASFNTGAAANVTVGHGLSVVPSMIILKNRSTQEWNVWHKNLTNTQDRFLILNANNGEGTSVRMWANTAPTSSVFSIESGYTIAASTDAIAYNFAEVPGYSKFGSYTGNGSTDGPFVFCGFRPRFILVKRSDAGAENWLLWDSSRMTYNVSSLEIKANLANAEADVAAANGWDQTSNGFKLRSGNSIFNTSTATYIYAAFAEHPFGGSNCAPAPAR